MVLILPPVLSTLVAEIYGEDPAVRLDLARRVLEVFDATEGVVDTDAYVEQAQPEVRFVVDRETAALAGVAPEQAAATLRLAVSGLPAGVVHGQRERGPVDVRVTLPLADRTDPSRLAALRVVGAAGDAVPLSEITRIDRRETEPFLYRKNGRPVTYVVGEVAGGEESPVYALMAMKDRIAAFPTPSGYAIEERFVDDRARPGAERLVSDLGISRRKG